MMDNLIVDAGKDVQTNEDVFQCLSKDIKSEEDNSWSERLIRKVKPEHALLLDSRIPKQIISFDEKYLHRCQELIEISALKVASCNIPSDTGVFLDNSSSKKISSGNIYDSNGIVIECPSVAGTENVIISSSGDTILGAITRSKSMINILKSPLLRLLGDSDSDVNFGRTSLVDVGELIYTNFLSSRGWSHTTTSQKLNKDMVVNRDHRHGSVPVHKSFGSLSSANSTCSDQSSSVPATVSQGMLHCTWNNGFPHYVFCVDGQREIYIANLLKIEPPDNKILDYMYTFHSRAGGRKEDDIHLKESDIVGKMRVSTSFTVLSDNSEIMETHFVLFGLSDDCVGEMQSTSHTLKKNKGFSKKVEEVEEVLKASHTYKQRNSTKMRISSAILENSSWDPSQDELNMLDPVSRAIRSEDHLVPNIELAAIIVRDHILDTDSEADIGGWGLKFLKKVGNRQTNASVETEVPSQCCVCNDGECSTSMDILIPAGFHGGPRTRNCGPSSLTERWRSGGRCDCGGWDIGCPITILNTRPSRTDVLPQTDHSLERRTFDLFVEGSNQDSPTMKMVNIHDDLYYIPFQSNLSAIQSFSIAAAIIHTRSPTLQPKLYKVK